MARKRSTLYWTLGLFMLAFVIRLAFIYPVRYNQPKEDAWEYDHIAGNLVQGNGYSEDGNAPTAKRLPVFPMLLAAVYSVFGRDWFAARVVVAILSALTVSVVYLTGVRLFDHKNGVIAAAMTAFHPVFLSIVRILYSESLFNLLMALAVLMLIKVGEGKAQTRDKLVAGVCLGLAAMTRPEPVTLFPFLIVWAFWITNFKVLDTIKLVVPILLPAIILLSIWTVRNYQAMDAFIPLTTNGGSTFRGVYNEITFTDERYMGRWLGTNKLPHADEIMALPEVEREHFRYQLAFSSIRDNLEKLPKLEVRKLHGFVFGTSIGVAILRFPIVFLAIVGLTISWRIATKKYSIIYMLLLFHLIHALVFFPLERYRTTVEVYIFMFAAFGAFEYLNFLAHYNARITGRSAVTD